MIKYVGCEKVEEMQMAIVISLSEVHCVWLHSEQIGMGAQAVHEQYIIFLSAKGFNKNCTLISHLVYY